MAGETHRIFAQDQWGDYLIYRLYPVTKVFIDGRSDFYGSEFGEEYLRLLTVQEGWNKALDRYGIDTIVLSPALALTSTLKISPDWRVVYDDHYSVVFLRRGVPLMRFEIDFLETEDAESIVAELKRIAALLGKTNVSALEVDTYGRVHYHIVVKRFGSLRRALEAAGLRCSRYTKATDEELLTR